MLDQQKLRVARYYAIRYLPDLIRDDIEISTIIEKIIIDQFNNQDESVRLLEVVEADPVDTAQLDELENHLLDQIETDGRLVEYLLKLQHRPEMFMERFTSLGNSLKLISDRLADMKGQGFEEMVAVSLRHALQNPDIKSENIRLRQKLVDKEGLIFSPGYETEVDLIILSGKLTVFEVKVPSGSDDVCLLWQKLKLFKAQNPDQAVEGLFVGVGVREEVRQRCADLGLELADF